MSGYPYYSSIFASNMQVGQAAQLRYDPGIPYGVRQDLHAIVHSGDEYGPFATTPNRFRDPTHSYDPQAQAVIDRALSYRR